MQVFASDICPVKSAIVLDDLRVNKMILESSQLLSTGIYLSNKEIKTPCHPGWFHHPLTKWTTLPVNFIWLREHLKALLDEFYFRREKKHSYLWHVDFYNKCFDDKNKKFNLISFVNCTIFKESKKNIFDIYKDYLNFKWKNFKVQPRWTKRSPPRWKT